MGADGLIDVFQQTLLIVIMAVSCLILPGLMMGLLIALLQAVTQINEMTISFLPKLLVILSTIVLLAPWLLNNMTSFTTKLIMDIPYILG